MNSTGMRRSVRSATGAYLERALAQVERDIAGGETPELTLARKKIKDELDRREVGGGRRVSANATAKRRARRARV